MFPLEFEAAVSIRIKRAPDCLLQLKQKLRGFCHLLLLFPDAQRDLILFSFVFERIAFFARTRLKRSLQKDRGSAEERNEN